MRIIAGSHRSRKLLTPPDAKVTRPITDRVKTALFDRLWSMGALDGGHAVDLFAGIGSLGLEALSRGVEHCAFLEQDRSILDLLQRNIADLKLADQSTVLGVDVLRASWVALLPRRPVHLVFCDPPYRMLEDEKTVARLNAMLDALASAAGPGCVLVLRTEEHAAALQLSGWSGPTSHGYGSMTVHLYQSGPHESGPAVAGGPVETT
jgi:16S rRNA (guanine966-N2)-methyltransferase